MNIYGKRERHTDEPDKLEEVTLVVTAEDLANLARFFTTCAEEMAANPEWEHRHFQDFLKSRRPANADLVVFAAGKLPASSA
jgi:hypothetical protein